MPKHRIERRRITDIEQWLEWRRADVTASVVGALFGLHPYETPYGLFYRAQGSPLPEASKAEEVARRRGHIFEDAVARCLQEKHPTLRVRKSNYYFRDIDRRIGASPDYFLRRDNKRGILQCKTVAPFIFKKFWTAEKPPTWIILQTLTEMMLYEASFGIIAALEIDGYKFEFHEYPVERHPASEKRILEAVDEFWANVEAGKIPQPDYARDGALIAAMSPHAVKGSTVDLRHDNRLPVLLEERAKIKAEIAEHEDRKEAIENEIKAKLGDNETALVTGWHVTNKTIFKKEFTVKPTSYRQLRATRDETFEATDTGKQTADA